MSVQMTMSKQNSSAEPLSGTFRLVVGGYESAGGVWSARNEISASGVPDRQLCVFWMIDAGSTGANSVNFRKSVRRRVDGLRLGIISPRLFDEVGMARTLTKETQLGWMPLNQAKILVAHVQKKRIVLLVSARTSDEQLKCSQIQLKHQPDFVHTFNFNR